MTRISFVCMGNICRSPTAEGIFKHLAAAAGRDGQFHVESAATGPWHVGEPPDSRAQRTARAHGVRLSSRAQQFRASDFERFDLVLALDRDVANELRTLAPTAEDRRKIRLLREFEPGASARDGAREMDVPDPYYGGPEAFESVYQMIERACRGLLAEFERERHGDQ